jgi:hypothetical protein
LQLAVVGRSPLWPEFGLGAPDNRQPATDNH